MGYELTFTEQDDNLWRIDLIAHGIWEACEDVPLNKLNYFKRLIKKDYFKGYDYIARYFKWF